MTDKELLKAAVDKAVKNGYVGTYTKRNHPEKVSYYTIIFKHNFAKAFWGDGYCECGCKNWHIESGLKKKDWEYHLQQLVLEDNPIRYLEKFI